MYTFITIGPVIELNEFFYYLGKENKAAKQQFLTF